MLDYFRLRPAKVIFISSLNREILNEILIASSFLPFFKCANVFTTILIIHHMAYKVKRIYLFFLQKSFLQTFALANFNLHKSP